MKPWLAKTHPGYFYVVVAVLASHVALAADAFMPQRHASRAFTYLRPDLTYFGVMHVIVAAVLLNALYQSPKWWWLARWALFVSIVTFNAAAAMIGLAVVHFGDVSLIGPTGLVALSLSSAAAWREPVVQPLRKGAS